MSCESGNKAFLLPKIEYFEYNFRKAFRTCKLILPPAFSIVNTKNKFL